MLLVAILEERTLREILKARTPEEVQANPAFRDKKVDVLLKPVKQREIEHSILNLVNS